MIGLWSIGTMASGGDPAEIQRPRPSPAHSEHLRNPLSRQLQQHHWNHQRQSDAHCCDPRRDEEEGDEADPPPLPLPERYDQKAGERHAKAGDAQHRADQRVGEGPPGEAVGHQQQGGRIDEDEGHQRLGDAQPEGGVAGLEGVRSGNACCGIGSQRHGWRDIGQHTVVEDEEMGHQRLNLQLRQRRGGDGDEDDIGGGGRDARAHDNAGDGDQDQREEQRPLADIEKAEGPDTAKEIANIGGGLHHDKAQPKPHARQRHNAHNDADCGGSGPNRKSGFRPRSQRLPQVNRRQAVGGVEKAHDHAGDDAVDGGVVGGFAVEDQINEDDQRDGRQPVVLEHDRDFRQLFGSQAAQA